MVRLKVVACRKNIIIIEISIPYGAIKSQVLKAALNNAFEFQFLMVRLKEIGNEPIVIKGEKFQFLMVRLKAKDPASHRCYY